jgi:hypothetical protein
MSLPRVNRSARTFSRAAEDPRPIRFVAQQRGTGFISLADLLIKREGYE